LNESDDEKCFCLLLAQFFLWPLKFGQISYGLGRASEFRAGPIRYCITIIIAMFLFFLTDYFM